ncbi:ABC transporter substrate-binding protein [Paenibacillus sp. YIM B09110]|uniref:ABC transporter substrate-binding protein n=1 Tax=Paenibacillus sp. YIM B09110 TaxID=3126102 RepID=UPI00301BE3B1
MTNTRKSLITLFCGVLMTSMLGACGNNSNGTNDNQAPVANDNATTAPASNDNGASDKKVTISLLTDNTQDAVNTAKAAIEAFEAKYPNITVEHETRPGGGEGDNFVKTRLSTGDMNDVFFYNSGSLMQALNPAQNMVDLTNEPFMDNVLDTFKTTVAFEGKVYGAPAGAALGGGWFYNKKVYADLGLTVPKTWDELMANNEKIKAAGITPVIGTYKDDWTSQMILLADYYNVQAQLPAFAEEYTANKAKFATTPAALRGFEKLQEVFDKGYLNKDFKATTYDAGVKMLAEGKGAHYPMLTFAVPVFEQNYPDTLDDIGFFAQPGDNADQNGLTAWMPGGAYIYKNTEHLEEAKKFVEFVASAEGMEVWAKVSKPTGPYLIKDAKLPDDISQIVKDMLPYFENNKTAPALEFVSPLKGPSLPQITTEVGAGFRPAKEGAELYDKDVEKQAQQLGLAGW